MEAKAWPVLYRVSVQNVGHMFAESSGIVLQVLEVPVGGVRNADMVMDDGAVRRHAAGNIGAHAGRQAGYEMLKLPTCWASSI